jgi:hypothetical protein
MLFQEIDLTFPYYKISYSPAFNLWLSDNNTKLISFLLVLRPFPLNNISVFPEVQSCDLFGLDIENILLENSNKSDINLMPMYYLGQWVGYGKITNARNADETANWYRNEHINMPDFIIFEGENKIETRTAEALAAFPGFEYETTISPGFIDRILFWLNPVNENQNAYIYRNTNSYPNKIE